MDKSYIWMFGNVDRRISNRSLLLQMYILLLPPVGENPLAMCFVFHFQVLLTCRWTGCSWGHLHAQPLMSNCTGLCSPESFLCWVVIAFITLSEDSWNHAPVMSIVTNFLSGCIVEIKKEIVSHEYIYGKLKQIMAYSHGGILLSKSSSFSSGCVSW